MYIKYPVYLYFIYLTYAYILYKLLLHKFNLLLSILQIILHIITIFSNLVIRIFLR